MHESILVQREGFAFYVPVIFLKMPDFWTNCQSIGHGIASCNKLKLKELGTRVDPPKDQPVKKPKGLGHKAYNRNYPKQYG